MIFRVKASAVNMPVDQRAHFVETVQGKLHLFLFGTQKSVFVDPEDTCGVEFSTEVEILYRTKNYGTPKD